MDIQIKFLEDCDPEDGRKIFPAESVKRLNRASAQHWIRRGKAVEITDKEIKDIKAAKAKIDVKNKAAAEAKKKADAKK